MEIIVKVDKDTGALLMQLAESISLLASATGFRKGEEPKEFKPVQKVEEMKEAPEKQEEVQKVFEEQPGPIVEETVVPVATAQYTLDQLAVAATTLVDAGKRDDLVALLNSFGVQALTALPKDKYGAFATSLRGMGAKI